MYRWLRISVLVAAVAMSYLAYAEETEVDAEPEARTKGSTDTRYVPLPPTFVTNYGIVEFGRLKYVRADIALKVTTLDAQMALQYHFPTLRNIVVLLLSRQEEGTVVSNSGREVMRKEALDEIRNMMIREEGAPLVEDVIFTNFVVQR